MVAQKITDLRKQRGLTQADMAEYLKISRQAYSFYEQGKHEMDYKSLCKIADFFQVTTDYLLGRYDSNPFLLDDDEEIEFIKKYRALDERAKRSIGVLLEHERAQNKKDTKKSAM